MVDNVAAKLTLHAAFMCTRHYKVGMYMAENGWECLGLAWLLNGTTAAALLVIQALVTAARAEKSTTVQRSYAQAAASVARYASEARMAKLVEEAVTMYTLPGKSCEPGA